jgi:hypothetical protein
VGKGSAVGVAAQLRVGSQLPRGTQLLRKPTVADGEALCDTVVVGEWLPERELAPLGLKVAVMEPEAHPVLESERENVALPEKEVDMEALPVTRKGERDAVEVGVWLREPTLGVEVLEEEGALMERVDVCEPDTLGEEEPVLDWVVVEVEVREMRAVAVAARSSVGVTVTEEVVEPEREGDEEGERDARDAE